MTVADSSALPPDNGEMLPRDPRSSQLERLSIRAFENLLPVERFLFRGEHRNDFGIDAELELLADGGATNLRGKVQLKATDSADTNPDGSVSLAVAAANLTYLLNGQCPLYVLYIHPRNELRFVWARDERNRIEADKPNWSAQGTITLRFTRLLTPDALDDVYERIRDEARRHREAVEALGRTAVAGRAVVPSSNMASITADGVGVEQIVQRLLDEGAALVAAGRAGEVFNLLERLPATTTRTPRLQAVSAYANFTLGRYAAAEAAVSEALRMATEGELSEDDRQRLIFLRRVCAFDPAIRPRQGAAEDYAAQVAQWEVEEQSANGNVAWYVLAHRLNAVRFAYLSENDERLRVQLLNEAVAITERILALPDANDGFKLNAHLTLLYIKGAALMSEMHTVVSDAAMQVRLRQTADEDRAKRFFLGPLLTWEQEIEEVTQRAREVGNPLLYADALVVRSSIRLPQFVILAPHRGRAALTPVVASDDIRVRDLEVAVIRAVSIYADAGSIEGELHAKALLADLFVLSGRAEDGKALAREVLPQAEAMGYAALVNRAHAHLRGETPYALRAETEEQDEDVLTAAMTDEQAHELAIRFLRAYRLPQERLPVMERDVLALRRGARERLGWCRHLELLQRLGHTRHPSTHLRTDPDRLCRCALHRFRSAIEISDPDAVVGAFKSAFCLQCADREPKQPETL